MRTYDEAFAAALDKPAFSSGTDGDEWMANWCDRCIHDAPMRAGRYENGCPLALLAVIGMTPSEWLRQPADAPDRYQCVEFRPEDDPGPGYEPPPDPPLPGQDVLFPMEPHTRMYADTVLRPTEVRT